MDFLRQSSLHGGRSLIPHTWQDVTVAIQRNRHRRVAQQLLHQLGMVSAGEQQRGAGVAQVVEPYVRQARLFEKRLKGGCAEIVEVQRFTAHGAEDEVVVLPQVADPKALRVLGRFVGLEGLDGPPREPYASPLAVLGRGEGRAGLGP